MSLSAYSLRTLIKKNDRMKILQSKKYSYKD